MNILPTSIILLAVTIILTLMILIMYVRLNSLERLFSQMLKNHGIMMRAMRRNGLITADDLVEIESTIQENKERSP